MMTVATTLMTDCWGTMSWNEDKSIDNLQTLLTKFKYLEN
jgi:hypothetical protein